MIINMCITLPSHTQSRTGLGTGYMTSVLGWDWGLSPGRRPGTGPGLGTESQRVGADRALSPILVMRTGPGLGTQGAGDLKVNAG